jgi:hypothetical protein
MIESLSKADVRALIVLLAGDGLPAGDVDRLVEAGLPRTELLAHLFLDKRVLTSWPRAAAALERQARAARFSPTTSAMPMPVRNQPGLSRLAAERLLQRMTERPEDADIMTTIAGRRHA